MNKELRGEAAAAALFVCVVAPHRAHQEAKRRDVGPARS